MFARFSKVLALALAVWLGLNGACYGQSALASFGRNRVQYSQQPWSFLVSNHFDIYYSPGSEAFARRTLTIAEQEYLRITELIGYAPYNRVRFYLYDSPLRQAQSNIGLETNTSMLGGKTNFIKSNIEVAFSASEAQLRKDVARGLARTVVYDMMYGGSFTEAVQNSYLMMLPEWFTEGAVAYAAEGWSLTLDNWARDEAEAGRMRHLSARQGSEAERLGQSFWAYVADRYGRTTISNVLNLTRIIRNEETALSSTLGTPYNQLVRDWRAGFTVAAEMTKQTLSPLPDAQILKLRTRAEDEIFGLALAPDGQHVAWASHDLGRTRLFSKNLATGRQRTLWRQGERHKDCIAVPSSPVAFIGNEKLATVYQRKNQLEMLVFTTRGRLLERYPLSDIDQVQYLAFSADGKKGVLVGADKGQTDIYQINPETGKIRKLTNDLADEADPVIDAKGQHVYFASTQVQYPADTAEASGPERRFAARSKICKLALTGKGQPSVIALSDGNLTAPYLHPSLGLLALSDASGVLNVVRADSAYLEQPVTGYVTSLERVAFTPNGKRMVALVRYDGRTRLLLQDTIVALGKEPLPESPWRQVHALRPASVPARYATGFLPSVAPKDTLPAPPPVIPSQPVLPTGNAGSPLSTIVLAAPVLAAPVLAAPVLAAVDSLEEQNPVVDIRQYVFEDEKQGSSQTSAAVAAAGVKPSGTNTMAPPTLSAVPARENTSARMGLPTLKELKSGRKLIQKDIYQPPVIVSGPYKAVNALTSNSVTTSFGIDPYRGWGLLMQANMADYFENHKFTLAVQPYLDFRSANYVADYQYLKHRVDFSAHFARNSLFISDDFAQKKNYQLVYQVGASYPISRALRVSASPYIQQTSYYNLFENTRKDERKRAYAGIKMEAVYDNSYTNASNITTGTKMRLVYDNNQGMRDAKRSFGSVFIDLRRYQRVHNEITLALRASGGRFFGPAKKQYMLGGMDNWLFNSAATQPASARDNPLANSELTQEGNVSWFYNPFVTNMRGFDYNTQYGNNFLLFNAELRVPLVKYLYKGPIASNFLRNFQLVGFTDIGSAWSGSSLLNKENSINTKVTRNGPFTITTTTSRNPFLIGYGAGVRTMMLGYYVKLDFALGQQDYTTLTRKLYLTFGYDF